MTAFIYLGILAALIAFAPPLITRALAGPKATEAQPNPALFDQARLELVSDPLSFAEHTAAALRLVEHQAEVIPLQRRAGEWS